jgi:putative hemolysin/heat shock protein HslJ
MRAKLCNRWVLLASLSLIFLLLTACEKSQPEPVIESETIVEPEGPIGPNPVEVYCTGLGYEFTTREREIDKQHQTQMPMDPTSEAHEGPQPEMPVIPNYILEVVCVFPDGNECEEEEFRSGRCGQEYSYCVQQGYKLEPGVNGSICIFPDGSSCPEIEFFNGNCGPSATQLSGTKWELIFLNGKDLIAGTAITLYFANEYLGGEMGCNGYGGSPDTGKYQAKSDGTFSLGSPFAVTVQLCPEPEGIMQQETEYIETLMTVSHYQIVDDRLEIKNEAGEMLVYQQK